MTITPVLPDAWAKPAGWFFIAQMFETIIAALDKKKLPRVEASAMW